MFEKLRAGVNAAIEKVATTELGGRKLSDIMWDFQLAFIQNDVAMDAAEAICKTVESELSGERIRRFSNPRSQIVAALRTTLLSILQPPNTLSFSEYLEEKKQQGEPCVVVFVGVNGTGKTTTIAKIAKQLLDQRYSVVLAAGDTFRAGAVEQLSQHGDKLGVRVIKHGYQADAAAVAFDGINHARAKHINVILIDTAGRMQTNQNLMAEMQKIVKVTNPDLKIFIGDALAGNDALEQAKQFNQAIGISGSILTKVDADAKGGTAVSIAYATKKPIFFVGIGQTYNDLKPFDPVWFVDKILPSS